MLVAVESYFLNALKAAFATGPVITAGPSAGPSSDTESLIEIVASRLTLVPEKGAEEGEPAGRSPAFCTRMHPFTADGKMDDFLLPADQTGEVVEVQSPAGHLMRRGDEYLVAGRAIRFYTPPAKGTDAVVVRVRGARARGYEQRLAGQIDLAIRVWAKERSRADDLARRALAAALIAATDLGILDGSDPATPAVSLRLLRAVTSLTGLGRAFAASGTKFHTTDLEFTLRGELEQTVALSAPEPEGIIREVRQRGT